MEQELLNAIIAAATTILVTLIGVVSKRVTAKLDAFMEQKGIADKIKSKQYLVDIAVKATEQIWINEKGEAKLARAKETVTQMLQEEGLAIGEVELNAFIEASVRSMNEGIKKGLAEND